MTTSWLQPVHKMHYLQRYAVLSLLLNTLKVCILGMHYLLRWNGPALSIKMLQKRIQYTFCKECIEVYCKMLQQVEVLLGQNLKYCLVKMLWIHDPKLSRIVNFRTRAVYSNMYFQPTSNEHSSLQLLSFSGEKR